MVPSIVSTAGAHHAPPQQACAACKYQRRKCAPDCALAPYFPHDKHRQFLNAHKLFGVSNITKTIKNLGPHEKAEAMKTIMFQSDARAHDSVLGCYGIVRDLQRKIELCQAELDLVLHHIDFCRRQEAAAAAGASLGCYNVVGASHVPPSPSPDPFNNRLGFAWGMEDSATSAPDSCDVMAPSSNCSSTTNYFHNQHQQLDNYSGSVHKQSFMADVDLTFDDNDDNIHKDDLKFEEIVDKSDPNDSANIKEEPRDHHVEELGNDRN